MKPRLRNLTSISSHMFFSYMKSKQLDGGAGEHMKVEEMLLEKKIKIRKREKEG